MKEICLDELKIVQLDIMSSIHRFCEKYHLRYSLSCGSMLGAARHKGYIPWDDDIDIYLLREDYDKMVKKGNYKIKSIVYDNFIKCKKDSEFVILLNDGQYIKTNYSTLVSKNIIGIIKSYKNYIWKYKNL